MKKLLISTSACLLTLSTSSLALAAIATPTPDPVPEPGTFFLIGLGILGLFGLKRRMKK